MTGFHNHKTSTVQNSNVNYNYKKPIKCIVDNQLRIYLNIYFGFPYITFH